MIVIEVMIRLIGDMTTIGRPMTITVIEEAMIIVTIIAIERHMIIAIVHTMIITAEEAMIITTEEAMIIITVIRTLMQVLSRETLVLAISIKTEICTEAAEAVSTTPPQIIIAVALLKAAIAILILIIIMALGAQPTTVGVAVEIMAFEIKMLGPERAPSAGSPTAIAAHGAAEIATRTVVL